MKSFIFCVIVRLANERNSERKKNSALSTWHMHAARRIVHFTEVVSGCVQALCGKLKKL